MKDTLSIRQKLIGIGISAAYASEISTGVRSPSLALAVRIYRQLGLTLGPLGGKTSEQIRLLAKASDVLEAGA